MTIKPFVSIVIPNLNNCQRLKKCLDALMKQTYPQDQYEIIVVDNGSTDGSLAFLEELQIQFYQYLDSKNPYPCRNLGIQKAKGEIIALLDSNCIPTSTWVDGGVEAIQKKVGDIILGPLQWEFSDRPSVFERMDYLLSDIKREDVAEKTALPGGNLFIPKALFENLGYFSEDTRSLGDIEWTGNAYREGYKFGFAAKAKVYYPAKPYRAFVKKAIRLGKGRRILNKKEDNGNVLKEWWLIAKLFLPPSPRFFNWLKQRDKRAEEHISHVQLFFLAWYYKILRGIGMLS